MSVATIRAAIASALDGMTDVRGSAYMSANVNPPPGGGHAMVDFEPSYDLVFGGGADQHNWRVTVFAQVSDDRSSQVFLDAIRDGQSATGIKQTLEAAAGIAAVCDYIWVRSASAIDIRRVGHDDYLAVDFICEVVA